jgi:membrane peptidoglycan carboxypeptidase
MLDNGAIDKKQAAAARTQPPQLAVPPETEPNDKYFLDTAEAEVKRLLGASPLDLAVNTTFDPALQDAAERAVQRWLEGEGARRQVGQAALVALAPDGAILAMVGGKDYAESQFNRATQAHRQPGSLFKIFVYLTALSNGYRPDSPVVDQQVQIGDWEPKNYDGRYRGRVSLTTAFAQSLNSVAAQLIQAIGPERVVAMAKSLGVQSDLPPVPSLALGSAEVTLLEMTRAMDAIATDSKSIESYTVRSIKSKGSAPIYIRPEAVSERPDWQGAWPDMMHLLEAVVTQGTGRAARLDRRAAGKTGTTDDYRDAWFVGFTTDLVVGVWVGNDDHSPMDQVAGGDIPAKIWHDFVGEAERIIARQPPAAHPSMAPGALTGTTMPPAAAAPPPTASDAPPPPAEVQPAAAMTQAAPRPLRGAPLVVDTGTLVVQGTVIHLDGVDGEAGEPAGELVRYLAGRPVACEPAGNGSGQYRCKLGDYDLGEAVVLNGAGRAAGNASERLHGAEERARGLGRGIWRR